MPTLLIMLLRRFLPKTLQLFIVAGMMLLIRPHPVFGERNLPKYIDSLLREYPMIRNDTARWTLLRDVSWIYSNLDPDQGLKYGSKALELATKSNRNSEIAWSYQVLAMNYFSKSDFINVIASCEKACEFYHADDNLSGMASSYSLIGNAYTARGDYPKALRYAFKALEIAEAEKDEAGIAAQMCAIGSIYSDKKDYVKALEYDLRCKELYTRIKDTFNLAGILNNIGLLYEDLDKVDSALVCFKMALDINTAMGNANWLAANTSNIGDVYARKKNYLLALGYFTGAVKQSRISGNKQYEASSLKRIGKLYFDMASDAQWAGNITSALKKDYLNRAVSSLDSSIAVCKEVNLLDVLIEATQELSDVYVWKNDYKGAFTAYKMYAATKDSVFSNENKVKIANLEAQHELGIKEKQIEIDKLAMSKVRNQRTFYISGIFVLLSVVGIVLRSNMVQKRTNTLLTIEKKRSDDLLLNILPSEVAEELKETGEAVARNFDHVTVLLTDFVSFTSAGEKLSPRELIDELHTCFKKFDEITTRHQVEKIKTIGDAYLAIAGLPSADVQHAEHVVKAALEMQAFMDTRYSVLGDATFRARIGVHSGSVVAGIVGVKKFAYDIWGDTVNTVARMEQNCDPGKINISQTTYELVKDHFHCEYRGEIEAKGKGMMKMYFVCGD